MIGPSEIIHSDKIISTRVLRLTVGAILTQMISIQKNIQRHLKIISKLSMFLVKGDWPCNLLGVRLVTEDCIVRAISVAVLQLSFGCV